jgi:hypothetical protein
LCKSWKPLHYGTCQVDISHCVNFGACLEILTPSISWRPITGYNGRVLYLAYNTWFGNLIPRSNQLLDMMIQNPGKLH